LIKFSGTWEPSLIFLWRSKLFSIFETKTFRYTSPLHSSNKNTKKEQIQVQYRNGAKDVLFLETKMFLIWKKCSFFRNKSWFVLEKVTFLPLFRYWTWIRIKKRTLVYPVSLGWTDRPTHGLEEHDTHHMIIIFVPPQAAFRIVRKCFKRFRKFQIFSC
jgi:hypothetical protein